MNLTVRPVTGRAWQGPRARSPRRFGDGHEVSPAWYPAVQNEWEKMQYEADPRWLELVAAARDAHVNLGAYLLTKAHASCADPPDDLRRYDNRPERLKG